MSDLEVTDIVEYDGFGKSDRYRVKSFLREEKWDAAQRERIPDIEPWLEEIIDQILDEEIEEERKLHPGKTRVRYHWCPKEEATHVSIYGVCGAIVSLDEVRRIEPVSWSAEQIARERDEAKRLYGKNTGWVWR